MLPFCDLAFGFLNVLFLNYRVLQFGQILVAVCVWIFGGRRDYRVRWFFKFYCSSPRVGRLVSPSLTGTATPARVRL